MKPTLFFLFFVILSYSIIAKSSGELCDKTLNDLRTKTYGFNTQIQLQHQSILNEIEKLEQKGSVSLKEQYLLKKAVREFVGNLKNTLESQPNQTVHGLMEIWIEKEISMMGYLPGFDNINVGYRNIHELDSAIMKHNLWPLLNSYFNSASTIQVLLYAQRSHRFDINTLKLVQIGLPRIWNALLIREYALRHGIQRDDRPLPHGRGSIQGIFDSIENELTELLLAK